MNQRQKVQLINKWKFYYQAVFWGAFLFRHEIKL